MAITKAYVLTLEEKQLIQSWVDNQRKMRVNASIRGEDDDQGQQAPEVYIALPPDSGIPALSPGATDVAGSAECDIYHVIYNSENEAEIQPVPGFKHTVLNLSSSVIAQDWILVVRDKYGNWFAVTGGGGSAPQTRKRGLTKIVGTGTADVNAIESGTPEAPTSGYIQIWESISDTPGAPKAPTGEVILFWDDGMVPDDGLPENTWIQIKQDLQEDSQWWYDGGCKVVASGTGTGTVTDWTWG